VKPGISPNPQAGSSNEPTKLLAEARRGAGDRLGKLLDLYRNYLILLAGSQLDRKLRPRVSPSDIVQETMLEAHRDFRQFRGETESEFVAWLRQILVNNLSRVIEMHVLAAKRDVRREISIEQIAAASDRSTLRLCALLQGREETPSAQVERHEKAVVLADLLSQLSGQHREVIFLRNIQGLRFEEVASRMDRSVAAAKMLWLRAIKQLRGLYRRQENE
jgi:RNA polymerase sigma-70 factor (ECF subfamily)